MRITYFKSIFLGLGVLLTLNGCKLLKPVEPPTAVQAPPSYLASRDSASIGTIRWREFFADPFLISLVDTALQNNLDLRIALQRIEAARTDVWLRRAAMLPVVGAEVSGGVRRYGDYTMDGVGNYDTNFSDRIDENRRIPNPVPDYFVGLRSAWEVDLWGKLRNQREAAYARFLATEKGRQLVLTQLIAEVATRYYELLALDNELDILRKNGQLQQSAVETIVIQKQGGRANELAVRQFRAQLLNTQGLEVQKNQEIIEIENQLNLLLGRFPQSIRRGEPIRQQVLPADVKAGIPSASLRRRPDVQQAELELLATRSDLQAARVAFLPSLTITAHSGFNAFKSALLFSPGSAAYGLLAGLSAPLINRRALKASQRRAETTSLEALYNYNKTLLTGYQEVVTNLRKLENLEQIEAFKEQEVEELRQAVAVSNDLFLAGYATYLEIITAQKTVLEAELELTRIQKEQFVTLITLYRSLGGGWE
ncbi:TolC family protein [Rhabdobacter roseus]|uniref:NodT family efflux transporter outer membrane factor (OMF) lipoprotein n=1 Tax=Rhabdobacter roseus TaxID=1655419 RepID=A0A840TJ16_9BACT|nr:TolC family protein [Rhabdobacter roseus]MBB5284186.1 NodT family efflux transporter outer membrane factor (OMF) lipoprotein [Rhabdobacter roseus]